MFVLLPFPSPFFPSFKVIKRRWCLPSSLLPPSPPPDDSFSALRKAFNAWAGEVRERVLNDTDTHREREETRCLTLSHHSFKGLL